MQLVSFRLNLQLTQKTFKKESKSNHFYQLLIREYIFRFIRQSVNAYIVTIHHVYMFKLTNLITMTSFYTPPEMTFPGGGVKKQTSVMK